MAGAITINRAALTVTASSGSMTYGGTPPAIIAGLLRLRQRRHRVVADHGTDLSDHGDQLEPGLGLAVLRRRARGRSTPNYSFTYVPGSVTVSPAALTVTARQRLR